MKNKILLKIAGKLIDTIRFWCLKRVEQYNGYYKYKKIFTEINPDLSQQYTIKANVTPMYELDVRNQHCFQALFTAKAIKKLKGQRNMPGGRYRIVDIGDSAGNHLKYLKYLFNHEQDIEIDGISINLDKTAVEKINASGGKAILCRAEEYNPEYNVDFYLSYEMLEHLHNPALFLYRLAKADKGKYMIITVPYLAQSRVGLHRSTDGTSNPITAEQEHIFELSPTDWIKLCQHAGWKVLWSDIYFQYPTNIPIVSGVCKAIWKRYDFEGFVGLVLERDMSVANRYKDWEE